MPLSRRLPARYLGLTLALTLAAGACTSAGDGTSRAPRAGASAAPTGQPDRQHPVVAFLRPAQRAVFAADAAGRTWKAGEVQPGQDSFSGLDTWPSQFAWSPDGRSLAWLDADGGSATGQIHLLDVRTGRQTSRPCPCSGIGFLGDDAVSLSADGSSLLLFPASGGPRRIALAARQRPYARLAAGGTDDVILFSPLVDGPGVVRGEGTLAVADLRGGVRRLLAAEGRTTFAGAQRQPDGPGLAWASHDSGGACWSMESVLTHPGTRSGEPGRPMPHDTAFRHALVTKARLVTSLAWAGDGVTATFSPMPNCQVMSPERTVSYYLRDGRWTYLGSGMLGIALGGDGRVVRLEDPVYPRARSATASASPTGTLTLTGGSRKLVLAEGVSLFALTPAESAAARPPAAARQPSEGVTAEDDHGARLPAAVRKLAGDIEDAAARGDTKRLVALCDPCSAAERRWIGTDDGPRAVLRAIRTHPRRSSTGDLLYPNPSACVDEPATDISCTPQRLRDAAVLRLKPGLAPGLDYNGSSYTAGDAVTVPLTVRIEGGTARWTGLAAG
ncbi:hypothetical protein ACFY71_10525 [Streptomyces cinerochromogenes]|uniref:hypothetical protein n=1 Tax=Streptomyces cinerochromogenes TaxID=66422 RepID=UPI0036BC5CD5